MSKSVRGFKTISIMCPTSMVQLHLGNGFSESVSVYGGCKNVSNVYRTVEGNVISLNVSANTFESSHFIAPPVTDIFKKHSLPAHNSTNSVCFSGFCQLPKGLSCSVSNIYTVKEAIEYKGILDVYQDLFVRLSKSTNSRGERAGIGQWCVIIYRGGVKTGFIGKGESSGFIKPQIDNLELFSFMPKRYVMANRETVNGYTLIQGMRCSCNSLFTVDIQSSDSFPDLITTLKERNITSSVCGRDYNRQSKLSPASVGVLLSDKVELSKKLSDFVLLSSASHPTSTTESLVNRQLSFLYHSLAGLGQEELDILHQDICLEQENLWYAEYRLQKQQRMPVQRVNKFFPPGTKGKYAVSQVSVDLTTYSWQCQEEYIFDLIPDTAGSPCYSSVKIRMRTSGNMSVYGYLDRLTREVSLNKGPQIDCRLKTSIIGIGGGRTIMFNATGEYLLQREEPISHDLSLSTDFIFDTREVAPLEERFDEEGEVMRIDRMNSYLYKGFEGVELGMFDDGGFDIGGFLEDFGKGVVEVVEEGVSVVDKVGNTLKSILGEGYEAIMHLILMIVALVVVLIAAAVGLKMVFNSLPSCHTKRSKSMKYNRWVTFASISIIRYFYFSSCTVLVYRGDCKCSLVMKNKTNNPTFSQEDPEQGIRPNSSEQRLYSSMTRPTSTKRSKLAKYYAPG